MFCRSDCGVKYFCTYPDACKLNEDFALADSGGCTIHTNEDHALEEAMMKHSCRSLIGTLTAVTLMGLVSPAAMADGPAPSPSDDVVAEQPTNPPAETPTADSSAPPATNAPSAAPAETQPTTAPDPTADPSNKPSDPPAEPKREWREENGKQYFYENGVKKTDTWRLIHRGV